MSIVVSDCRPINGSCVIAARIFTNDVVAAIVPLKTLRSYRDWETDRKSVV